MILNKLIHRNYIYHTKMTDKTTTPETTTTTATNDTAATAKEQVEADKEELNVLVSETVREMNSRPGSNPDQTGEIVHRLLKSARDIQGEKDGFVTKSEAFTLAIDRHNEFVIAEAAKADNRSQ